MSGAYHAEKAGPDNKREGEQSTSSRMKAHTKVFQEALARQEQEVPV